MAQNAGIEELYDMGSLPDFESSVMQAGLKVLRAGKISVLQMNITAKCNLACKHCHVNASASRNEEMTVRVMTKCLEFAEKNGIETIDITGGAPEMNPGLQMLIEHAGRLCKRLIVRSNLDILAKDDYKKFMDIYAKNKVEIVTSVPDYHREKTDLQRGDGVFANVVKIMKELNKMGYAQEGTGLALDLVHNPVGAYLPGPQRVLEFEYRERLLREYGVNFNRLFCITNMPIGRYLKYLKRTGNFEEYMESLVNNFNPCAVSSAMCRSMISVKWDGAIYDCDFNQMLDLPSNVDNKDIFSFDINELNHRNIVTANHCYGCTAGSGSSCQGSTAE
jgi:radical SAM/Cys-rich protein